MSPCRMAGGDGAAAMLAALNHRAQQLDARKQLYLLRVLEKLERAQQVRVRVLRTARLPLSRPPVSSSVSSPPSSALP
jgi:hypothetical protein